MFLSDNRIINILLWESEALNMKKIFLALITVLIIIVAVISIQNKKTIKIGVISTLSGKYSDLGISVLNGVLIGTEEINKNLKFYEPKINLIIKDDKHSEKEAEKVLKELLDENVVAIIGPETSTMAVHISRIGNDHKKIIISPTAATTELLEKDDYFIRLNPAATETAAAVAKFSKEQLNLKKVLIICSEKNPAYALTLKERYVEEFCDDLSERKAYIKYISDNTDEYFAKIRNEIDGIFIIANAIDAAGITQRIRKIDSNLPIIISGWSFNSDFITYGGKNVEGVYSTTHYNSNYNGEKFKKFKSDYRKKFKEDPNSSALFSYESINILSEAIRRSKTKSSEELKKEILSDESDKFFLQPGKLDKYGDSQRKIYIFQVKDKKFERVELGRQ